jgi:hypothetical protein
MSRSLGLKSLTHESRKLDRDVLEVGGQIEQ